ncbi:glycosyltransferase family 2 protein [Bradyrhizobium lablabi]|uniref:glycosyltransferase family 2 protein n=1 Tax=Bradyrhizobium lablabi TaxID=722472 RepID=UPI002012610D|nr:glycosyltransferase [Bradyrhizobium lablabi]
MLAFIADLPLGEGVTHISVTSPADIAGAEAREGMTVFWYGDRPIGHVLAHQGQRIGSSIDHIDSDYLLAIEGELQRQVKPTVSASVVICTRDRPDELAACLASLPRQSCRPREIVVVDNASRDRRTRDVALAAGVTYIREDRPGLDVARNAGVLRATGDIVAFTDDDVLLHPHWLERLVAAFDRPQIAAVTGLVLPAELATEAQRHFETYWGFGRGYREQDFDSSCFNGAFPAWEIGAGASMAFRRDVFEKVGLFDDRLDVGQAGCSGDSEYWYRLLASGHECRYVPSSVAFHSHRRTVEGLASQIYYYMRGHVAALLVQYERTGLPENRMRAYLYLPKWYSYRLLRRAFGRKRIEDRFLNEEIAGCVSGIRFYHREGKRR